MNRVVQIYTHATSCSSRNTRSSSLSVQLSLPPLTILRPSELLLPASPSIHLKGPIAIVFSSVNLRYILVYPTFSSSIMSSVHLHHVTLCLSVQRPLLQSTRGWGGGGGGGVGEGKVGGGRGSFSYQTELVDLFLAPLPPPFGRPLEKRDLLLTKLNKNKLKGYTRLSTDERSK